MIFFLQQFVTVDNYVCAAN